MDRDTIYRACQEIHESGGEVSISEVVKRIGGSRRDVSPVVREFKESLKEETGLAVSDSGNGATPIKSTETPEVSGPGVHQSEVDVPDHVIEMAKRAYSQAEYIVGGELVLTEQLVENLRKTRKFTNPEIQAKVDAAKKRTADSFQEELKKISPEAMLERFGNGETIPTV